jgi:DNA repair exonuclease SbcCD nuclease subunit
MFAEHSSGENSRRAEILSRVDSIISLTQDGTYDAVLFGGDFYHERGKIDTVSLVYSKEIMKKLHPATKFIACSGTHDLARDGKSALAAFVEENAPKRFFIDEPCLLGRGSTVVAVVAVPDPVIYEEHEVRIREALGQVKVDFPKILLSHGFVVGSREFEAEPWMSKGVSQSFLRENFILSILGHLHQPILSQSDRGIILIPGAVIPHNFGDDCGGGSYYDVEVSGKEVLVRRHAFAHPQFLTVDDTFHSFDREDYYRVRTSDKNYALPEGIRGFSQYTEQAGAESERSELRLADSPETLVEKYARSKPVSITEVGKSIVRGLALSDNNLQGAIEEIMSRVEL